jgi:uncharacterized protein (UPF0305 family)
MFEKSKSEITFKEFQYKLNIVNNFENEWGHFCDPDDNSNTIFYNNLYEPIKKKVKKIKKIEERKVEKVEEPFIDIEKLEKLENKIDEYENDDIKFCIIDTIFICLSLTFVTFIAVKINNFTSNI